MPSTLSTILLVAVVPTILALNLRTGGPEEGTLGWTQRRLGRNSTIVIYGDDYSDDDDSISDEAYSHIGCFEITEDVFNAYDASDLSYSSVMTTDRCYKTCVRKKATFIALSNGFVCWCGSKEEELYTQGGGGMCDSPCWGDQDMICGGDQAFDLYRVGEDAVESTMPRESTDDDSEPSPTGASTAQMPQERSTPSPITIDMEPSPAPTTPNPISPPTFMPATSLTPSPTAPTLDPTDGSFIPGPAPTEMETLLELHNLARCEHNANPLTYSETVAASAAAYAQVLASACGGLFHSDSPYGENLYMCYGGSTCYSPENAMALLYESEITGSSVNQYGGHATQILWKSTEELGCGLGYCGDRTYLVCQYNPPGNYIGRYEENVELPSGNGCYP